MNNELNIFELYEERKKPFQKELRLRILCFLMYLIEVSKELDNVQNKDILFDSNIMSWEYDCKSSEVKFKIGTDEVGTYSINEKYAEELKNVLSLYYPRIKCISRGFFHLERKTVLISFKVDSTRESEMDALGKEFLEVLKNTFLRINAVYNLGIIRAELSLKEIYR